jgi:hypothetical protein
LISVELELDVPINGWCKKALGLNDICDKWSMPGVFIVEEILSKSLSVS